MSGRRTTKRILLAGALAVAFLVPMLQPSMAWAASCSASGCNGLDPDSTGCDDPSTTHTLDSFVSDIDGSSLVELRYSSVCDAAWARLTTGAYGMPTHHYLLLQVWNAQSGGSLVTIQWLVTPETTPAQTRYWTPMWTFDDWNQACLKNGVHGDGPCTGRH
jgi:hypothetical protein